MPQKDYHVAQGATSHRSGHGNLQPWWRWSGRSPSHLGRGSAARKRAGPSLRSAGEFQARRAGSAEPAPVPQGAGAYVPWPFARRLSPLAN